MNIRIASKSIGYYLPVRVNGKVVQTVNPRSKNWPKVKYTCVECGIGKPCNWFNHAMDGAL